MTTLEDKLGTQKRFGFTSKALPPGTFAVAELSGTEAISRPYEFDLLLVSGDANLSMEAVLDQPATLTIHPRAGDPQPIPYHGLVKQLEQAHQVGPYTFYRVSLAPRVWGLSLDRISEVYLDRTIPQILDLKLKENGLTSQDYELKLASTYKPWPYVCQYQETDLAFITRLMERDGIYFFFEQGTDREKLIIIDAKAMQAASVRQVSYRPAAQMETGVSEESMQAWVCRQKPVPRKVVLQDYNYRTASLALSAEADVALSGKGEMRIYGEAFETQQEGKALAMVRAQELACRKKTFQGDGTATGLRAGFFMEMHGHYRADFNGRYLVTEVRHEGAQAGTLLAGLEGGATGGRAREDFYRNECAAIPADIQFRPERLTPKPVIHGTMTAFVDAEGSGQYAELDDQGRYKVQLPFDKTDKEPTKASAWIRMATPYSGKDHGMHFPLHKGAEVLLSFQDGDPNWPVITAAVPNSDNPNLVTRSNQTQSAIHTAGSNLLTFEDKEGSERIYLKTPKAQTHIRMGAAKTDTPSAEPGACEKGEEKINGLCFETEAHSYTKVGGNSIEIIKGDSTETVDGKMVETVGGDSVETIGGNFRETVGGNSFSLIKGGYNGEVILGADTYIVAGPRVDTALGVSIDFFLGVWMLEFAVGVSTEVHNFHVNATDNEIKAISTTIEAHGARITAAEQDIGTHTNQIIAAAQQLTAAEQRITTTETTIGAHGNRITTAETTIGTHGQRITTAETNIGTMATDIQDCETSIVNVATDLADKESVIVNAAIFIIS
ncbi:MAG: type VI secretion system tip protein VgrG [Nitrospira sp.]|nr:type VI secretion system tip protein VgrG [Nitrospira sp.]